MIAGDDVKSSEPCLRWVYHRLKLVYKLDKLLENQVPKFSNTWPSFMCHQLAKSNTFALLPYMGRAYLNPPETCVNEIMSRASQVLIG